MLPQDEACEEAGRHQYVKKARSERHCPNCARMTEKLQDFKMWDEFFEFEVACAEDESDLLKSILTFVRTRHLLGTNRHASLLELSEAAQKSW